ncbi:unnamed protein product [Effrenium voratum]|nr:unnamed protein product [Effrenium voratum]
MAKYQHLLAFGIVSWCLAAEDESSCTNRLDLLDVSFFMQVKQNSTVQTVPAQHNRTWPSMLLDNMNRAWAGQQMPLSPGAQSSSESSGTALLDIIIIVVMIGSQTGGIVLLNVVTMLFGSNQVLVKILETDDATHAMDSFLCMGLRFGVGALALRAFMLTKRKDKEAAPEAAPASWADGSTAKAGVELSVWLFLGFATQAVGLQYTSASSGALLGSLTTVLVPLLSLLDGRHIDRLTWGSVCLALVGAVLFVGPSAISRAISSRGDVLELGSAAFFAVYIWRCEKLIRQLPESEVAPLTCLQLALVSCFSFLCFFAEGVSLASAMHMLAFPAGSWALLLALGVVTTGFCLWAEAKALREVDATVAALIYACEPVWGAIFAYVWRGETLDGPYAMSGAAFLLVASVTGVMASIADEGSTLDAKGPCS